MSHFLVMVIGSDPAKQLAPFHEFECTGKDDQYVKAIDKTEECKSGYQKLLAARAEKKEKKVLAGEPTSENDEEMSFYDYVTDYCGYNAVPFGQEPDLEGKNKYTQAFVDENGEILKVIQRTNPQAKWDWYVLGGRYSGRLIVKDGATGGKGEPGVFENEVGIDQAKKGDIDLEKMRQEAAEEAADEYGLFAQVTKGQPWPEDWQAILARYGEKRVDEARAFYHAQPMIKAMRASDKLSPFASPEDYGQDREKYIKSRVESRGVPFAFVRDGKWFERGEMGGWGIATDEKDKDAWNADFWKMYDELPDDTLISMMDCHI